MSLTDDINNLPVTVDSMMPGHLGHHATIHSALKNYNNRASITWSYEGTGTPSLSSYPGIKVGDYIVRKSDGQEWRVDL